MNALAKLKSEQSHRPSHLSAKRIRERVASAADVVAPLWPLKTFIAVNPLQGLEDLPFEQAALVAERFKTIDRQGLAGREAVNRELIKWCSVFFDEGQSAIPMPNAHLGLYRAFADLAPFDRGLKRFRGAHAWLASLPQSPEAAIAECLERLRIPADQTEEFFRQAFAALPGWSGHVKWHERWRSRGEAAMRPATLLDFLAVRLVLTCLLWPDAKCIEVRSAAGPVYLEQLPVAEKRYRDGLLAQLLPRSRAIASPERHRPEAQLVFCIDVRSEPFRRALEAQGDYETLGFAGFFGLPVRVKGYDDDHPHASCPVLLEPCHDVCEQPTGADAICIRRHEFGRDLLRQPRSFYRWLKYNFATPFALVEMLGPWLGLRMLARTFAPSIASGVAASARSALMPAVRTEPDLGEICMTQQADLAESALRLMGLTASVAPLVVLCGHGSTTTNNAYAAALDCGACGGNHGGPNARILAAILNSDPVRSILASRGLPIPDDTLFVAAEHDTTTDRVGLFPPADASAEHRGRIDRLGIDLARAGAQNAQIRSSSLGLGSVPAAEAESAVKRRSADWAEVRPEWGLARNAAFLVGPRELSRHVDLEGRCFLHSYDWKADQDGKFLQTILTAPMVVAQWINSQYLFSTLDNVAYGAGSKVTKNVTGKIGVMQGNASDLMHGLPLQSVFSADDTPYHQPLRLLTVVHAPRSRVAALVERNPALQKLFFNGWVTLTVIDPQDGCGYLLERNGDWQKT